MPVKPKRSYCMTLIRLLDCYSCWRAAVSYQTVLLPSDHLHPSMCPPFVSPFTPSLSCFLLPSFSHSLSGRAPVEAPVSPTLSQQGLEAAAAATVSELKPMNHHILFKECGKQCSRILSKYVESMGHMCSWEFCPCYFTETMTEKTSTS